MIWLYSSITNAEAPLMRISWLYLGFLITMNQFVMCLLFSSIINADLGWEFGLSKCHFNSLDVQFVADLYHTVWIKFSFTFLVSWFAKPMLKL